MLRLVVRRVGQAIPLLALMSVVVFGLIHLAPGGPLTMYLSNPNVRPADIERLRHALGLDQPLWRQYVSWLSAFVQGDWGYSYADGRPVLQRIIERVPATLELLTTSIVVAIAVAIPAGVLSAVWHRRWFDRVTTAIAFAGISLPVFWFGLLLQIIFSIELGWFPSAGRSTPGAGDLLDRLNHLILPAAILVFVQAAAWSRYLRSSMTEVLRRPFLTAARARGVPARTLIASHAFRNALPSTITVVMLDAAIMVSGAVVTESVFAWPGVGSLFTEALARRDYTVLMALLMLSSLAVVLFNLIADVVNGYLDPRTANGL